MGHGTAVCECGRVVLDELHSVRARELASAAAFDRHGLITEKGT